MAQRCVASLIANHAGLDVVDALAGFMAQRARPFGAEMVVGLPTLGLAFAPMVARGLGFTRYVPFGYSRKYWYDEKLAVPVRSLTTPDAGKLLYVDPNLAGSLAGRRVLVVDDAVSTGQTMVSALELLARCGAEVAGIFVAMCQRPLALAPGGRARRAHTGGLRVRVSAHATRAGRLGAGAPAARDSGSRRSEKPCASFLAR